MTLQLHKNICIQRSSPLCVKEFTTAWESNVCTQCALGYTEIVPLPPDLTGVDGDCKDPKGHFTYKWTLNARPFYGGAGYCGRHKAKHLNGRKSPALCQQIRQQYPNEFAYEVLRSEMTEEHAYLHEAHILSKACVKRYQLTNLTASSPHSNYPTPRPTGDVTDDTIDIIYFLTKHLDKYHFILDASATNLLDLPTLAVLEDRGTIRVQGPYVTLLDHTYLM